MIPVEILTLIVAAAEDSTPHLEGHIGRRNAPFGDSLYPLCTMAAVPHTHVYGVLSMGTIIIILIIDRVLIGGIARMHFLKELLGLWPHPNNLNLCQLPAITRR